MRASLAAVIGAACLAMAACGSSGGSGPATSATSGPGPGSPASSAPVTSAAAPAVVAASSSAPASPCPTGAAVSAAAGGSYPDPQVEPGGGLTMCSYADPATHAALTIQISDAPGITEAQVQYQAQSSAQAQGAYARTVDGIGDDAFEFTLDDASSNPDGVATATVIVLAGSSEITVAGQVAPSAAEAVATLVAAG